MRLFRESEGSVPKDSTQGKGNEAGEEVGIGVTMWGESRRGRRGCASEGELREDE